ncbi:hypothetical protein NIES4071_96410 [Calothrix sp. NIES-4071]|nr:hypothetical protein NIES4071_96410 [Calothrix sp. NIES-4071]BAZ63906.1 hypothetical protein NIES4105_96340 [Calothrix sp. NIES-4105]
MEYLITPIEETDWRINELDLINHLSEKWSNVQIKEITNLDDFYCFEGLINLSGNDKTLEFALHRDRQGVSLDGYLENCALFAVWLRSLVPQDQKLAFYDQGYNAHIELNQNTTELEIINSFISTVLPLV